MKEKNVISLFYLPKLGLCLPMSVPYSLRNCDRMAFFLVSASASLGQLIFVYNAFESRAGATKSSFDASSALSLTGS